MRSSICGRPASRSIVVSPASFRHFGIAYGDGIANNLRARPWKVLLLPLFLLSFARAARRAARDADVVHAHWLPSGVAGLATRKPLVVQLWGTDVELAKRLPWLFRPVLRGADVVVCASKALAEDARALGARDVRVIPSGVDDPGESSAIPTSRRTCCTWGGSPRRRECGSSSRRRAACRSSSSATARLRDLLPQTVGFVPHDELGPVLRAGRGRRRAVAA